MAVKEILDDRVIDLNMNAKNKDEVIRHLAGLLKMPDTLRIWRGM